MPPRLAPRYNVHSVAVQEAHSKQPLTVQARPPTPHGESSTTSSQSEGPRQQRRAQFAQQEDEVQDNQDNITLQRSPSEQSSESGSTSSFQTLLSSANLPEPGPAHYTARRALWLAAPSDPATPSSPSPSRLKLEALLNQDGAVESEEVWRAGLKNVWKGLVGGNQLRKRLPLDIVLKILLAGWLRDGTWPQGMSAPEPDDILLDPDPGSLSTSLLPELTPGPSSLLVSPQPRQHMGSYSRSGGLATFSQSPLTETPPPHTPPLEVEGDVDVYEEDELEEGIDVVPIHGDGRHEGG